MSGNDSVVGLCGNNSYTVVVYHHKTQSHAVHNQNLHKYATFTLNNTEFSFSKSPYSKNVSLFKKSKSQYSSNCKTIKTYSNVLV